MTFAASAGQIERLGDGAGIIGARPRGITTFGGRTLAYQTIWRTQPAVRTVVNWLAWNMSQLGLKLFERVSDDDRAYLREHDLDRLLRKPTPRTSRSRFVRGLISDVCIFDNFLALKLKSGTARALLRLPPQLVEPIGADWLDPEGYRLLCVRGQPEYPWDQIVHVRGYNPTDVRWGSSPIEALRQVLAEDLSAAEYREQFWRRGARMSGWLERAPDGPKWSDPARARFEEDWRAAWTGEGGGSSAGGTPILEDGMTFHGEAFSAVDSEYLGARKLTRSEVASAYHVQPGLVGITEDVNAAAMSEQRRNQYADSLGPLSDFTASELFVQLAPDFVDLDEDRHYLEFNLAAKLAGHFTERAEVLSRSVGAPWLTRNEARAMDNRGPVEGGDELVTPLNVTIGGRANPTDTAPGTPGAGQVGSASLKAVELEAKSQDDLDPTLLPWAVQHRDVTGNFLARQREAVLSRLGAGQTPVEAWDAERWNRELRQDLAGLALELAPVAADEVADRFGVTYAVDVAEAWLVNNARIAAEEFNAKTLAHVTQEWSAALPGTTSRKDLDEELTEAPPLTPFAAAAGVFDGIGTRADGFALDRVGQVANFARQDVASQAGAGQKTWRVRSQHPRASHAALDGVSVSIDQPFGNGLNWPHDPAGSADEVAGCTCMVDFDP